MIFLGAVQGKADEKAFPFEELAPLVIQQATVRLQRLGYRHARRLKRLDPKSHMLKKVQSC